MEEVFHLLEYNAVKSVESQPTFQRNMFLRNVSLLSTDSVVLYPKKKYS
jgi:hypothetical protein